MHEEETHLSYVIPSDPITGSVMISCVMGHKNEGLTVPGMMETHSIQAHGLLLW